MPNTRTLILFANHCRSLAIGARTHSVRDKYINMALAYDRAAEASEQLKEMLASCSVETDAPLWDARKRSLLGQTRGRTQAIAETGV